MRRTRLRAPEVHQRDSRWIENGVAGFDLPAGEDLGEPVCTEAGRRPRVEGEPGTGGLVGEPQVHPVGVFLGIDADALPERDMRCSVDPVERQLIEPIRRDRFVA